MIMCSMTQSTSTSMTLLLALIVHQKKTIDLQYVPLELLVADFALKHKQESNIDFIYLNSLLQILHFYLEFP